MMGIERDYQRLLRQAATPRPANDNRSTYGSLIIVALALIALAVFSKITVNVDSYNNQVFFQEPQQTGK